MTIRLLCAYDKYPANAIITLDAGTEAGLILAKVASATLTGGVAYFAPVAPSRTPQCLLGGGKSSISANESTTVQLPEGQALTVTGTAATGTVQRIDANNTVLQSWTVGSGTLAPIGPFTGTQQLLITCTAGSIDASVGDAVVGVSGVTYKSNIANQMPDGSPRSIAKGASVGALLVECSRSYTSWGGAPTLSVVNGINQTGAGAGTPIGVSMDLSAGLTGTPVSKTGMPSMLKCVTTTAADAISWKCILANGTGITSAGNAATITGSPQNFGFWVWISRLPGQDVGGTPAGQLQFTLTAANGGTGGTVVGFNNNQLKEGWNFLKFVDTRGTDAAGTHPLGISASFSADANDPFLAANSGAVRNINVSITGFAIGTTLIFDSAWTGIVSRAAFVLGCDSMGNDLVAYGLPKLQQYGFAGYVAAPRSIQAVAYGANVDRANIVADYTYAPANLYTLANAGWPIINHTMTHPNPVFPNMNGISTPEDIRYEIVAWAAWARGIGLPTAGSEFYAAPQGASSRLSELVIKNAGIKMQRCYSQQNVQRTPWGLSNPHSVGSFDFGDQTYQNTYAKIKATFDQIIAYGDVGMPFWHVIVTAGDPGDGTGLTGNGLWVYRSTFNMAIDYLAAKCAAGACDVLNMTDFYYGA